jgi:adenylate cyclase
MASEIERKFLVKSNEWREGNKAVRSCQGYLPSGDGCTVRVRLKGEQAFLTIKGNSEGITRLEYEYEIPVAEAKEILAKLCLQPYVEKNRYDVMYAGIKWEVDEFLGDNEGLVVAEVELESEDQQIALPPWIGEEVSRDPRYRNVNLVKHPYSQWGKP